MQYACIAVTENGGRCRFWAVPGGVMCARHEAANAEPTPAPDVILIKFRINQNWSEKFQKLGFEPKQTDFYRREQKHIATAQEVGRKAYRYATEQRAVADSGVPVFGQQGLLSTAINVATDEILATGYEVTNIHIEPSRHSDGMSVLIFTFAKEGERVSFPTGTAILVERLLAATWGHCHVWANPPSQEGKITHTVNCAHRQQETKHSHNLRFNKGLWEAARL